MKLLEQQPSEEMNTKGQQLPLYNNIHSDPALWIIMTWRKIRLFQFHFSHFEIPFRRIIFSSTQGSTGSIRVWRKIFYIRILSWMRQDRFHLVFILKTISVKFPGRENNDVEITIVR